MELTLENAARMSRGYLSRAEIGVKITGVCTDSRAVKPGELFVALRGEKFNGHDFLSDAEKLGASVLMVDEKEVGGWRGKTPTIVVEDTLIGLQRLAEAWRASLPSRTVVVAGSNGKTGTKEMIAAVLVEQFLVQRNEGNLNNHIGVPLSLLRIRSSHQVGVIEVGTNHPGELRPLLKMVRPVVGVITVIGEEHLEFFHDLEGVALEEGEVAEILPEDGLLVLNADDEWSLSIAQRTRSKVCWFGLKNSSEFSARNIRMGIEGTQFVLVTPSGEIEVCLKLLGEHQVLNALAASAVGGFFGLTLTQIAKGLGNVEPVKMRMQRMEAPGGVMIINDAYNANPSSMRAALKTVGAMELEGCRIAVLGEMRELGEAARRAHFEIGRFAVESGFDVILVVGDEAREIAEGARAAERSGVRVEMCDNPESAGEFLRRTTRRGDVVLLKASRGVALERSLTGWMESRG